MSSKQPAEVPENLIARDRQSVLAHPCSRRNFLHLTGYSLLALPLLATTRKAHAKTSKEAVQYQETPKDGKKCSGCHFFTAPNSCQVVDGDISPSGWCALYVDKPA